MNGSRPAATVPLDETGHRSVVRSARPECAGLDTSCGRRPSRVVEVERRLPHRPGRAGRRRGDGGWCDGCGARRGSSAPRRHGGCSASCRRGRGARSRPRIARVDCTAAGRAAVRPLRLITITSRGGEQREGEECDDPAAGAHDPKCRDHASSAAQPGRAGRERWSQRANMATKYRVPGTR